MARLPILNGDADQWGAILNEFLRVSHRENGTLKGTYEVVNIKDFGAIGDGVADDTEKIKNAILSLPSSGTVFFPPGIYMVGGLDFMNMIRPDGVRMIGSGTILPGLFIGQPEWGTIIRAIGPRSSFAIGKKFENSLKIAALLKDKPPQDIVLEFKNNGKELSNSAWVEPDDPNNIKWKIIDKDRLYRISPEGDHLIVTDDQRYVLRVNAVGLNIDGITLDGNYDTADAVLLFEYFSSWIAVRNCAIVRTQKEADIVRFGGQNLEIDQILFDNVKIRQISADKYARRGICLENSNTLIVDFRNCSIEEAKDLVYIKHAGASFRNCFFGDRSFVFHLEGTSQPLEISECYVEPGPPKDTPPERLEKFFLQESITYAADGDSNTPIALRHNYINGDLPLVFNRSQPVLLEGNLFKTDVVVKLTEKEGNCPSQQRSKQTIVAVGNVFGATTRKFTISDNISNDLDAEQLPQILADAFEAYTLPLDAASAKVIVEICGNRWTIHDSTTSYVISRLGQGELEVCPIGGFKFAPGNLETRETWIPLEEGVIQLGTNTPRSPVTGLINTLNSLKLGEEGQKITGHFSGTKMWDPPQLGAGMTTTVDVQVENAQQGDTVAVGFDRITKGGWQISGQVTAPGTVTVTLTNQTSTGADLPQGTVRADVWRH